MPHIRCVSQLIRLETHALQGIPRHIADYRRSEQTKDVGVFYRKFSGGG